MIRKARKRCRDGASAVEAAFVYPVAFLFILGLMVGGMGVFRYQQVAWLARQGSRWASVHGSQYATDTGHSAATATDVYNNAILPNAVSLDTSKLTYTVTPDPCGQPGTSVTVTVSYQWLPEVYLVGPLTLASTSTLTITY